MENVKIVQLEERMAEVEGKLVEVRNTNDFGVLGHVILNTPTEIKVLKKEIKGLEYKYEGNLEQNVSQSTFHPAIMGNEVAEYTAFNGTAREFIELHERKLSLLELILDIAKERKEIMDNSVNEEDNVMESAVNKELITEEENMSVISELESIGWEREHPLFNTAFMYDEPVADMTRDGFMIQITRIPNCDNFEDNSPSHTAVEKVPKDIDEMMSEIFSGGK